MNSNKRGFQQLESQQSESKSVKNFDHSEDADDIFKEGGILTKRQTKVDNKKVAKDPEGEYRVKCRYCLGFNGMLKNLNNHVLLKHPEI